MNKKTLPSKQPVMLSRLLYPDNRTRNHLFLTTLTITILVVLIVAGVGKHQNQSYLDNWQRYQQAESHVDQGQYAQAIETFSNLDSGFGDTYMALYYTAFSHGAMKNYEEAARYMQKARQAYPPFLEDPYFLLEYGQYLYHLGDYEEARSYLQQSLKFAADAEVPAMANELLAQIGPLDEGSRADE